MFDFIKGLLDVSYVKLGLIAVIVAALSGFVVYYDKSRYQAGYNAAVASLMEKSAKDMATIQSSHKQRLNALQDMLDEATKKYNNQRNLAVELQELLDATPTVDNREIDNVKIDNCVNIGDDYQRVLHNIIGTAPIIPTSK